MTIELVRKPASPGKGGELKTPVAGSAFSLDGANNINEGTLRFNSSNENAGVSFFNTKPSPTTDARNWLIATNYTAFGDLAFRVSSTNVGNPASTVFQILKEGSCVLGISALNAAHKAYSARTDTYSATAANDEIFEFRNFKTGAANNFAGLMFRATTGDATASAWQIGNVTLGGSNLSDFIFKAQTAPSTFAELLRMTPSGALTIGNSSNGKITVFGLGGVSGSNWKLAMQGESSTIAGSAIIQFGDNVSGASRQWAITNGRNHTAQDLAAMNFIVSGAVNTDALSGTGISVLRIDTTAGVLFRSNNTSGPVGQLGPTIGRLQASTTVQINNAANANFQPTGSGCMAMIRGYSASGHRFLDLVWFGESNAWTTPTTLSSKAQNAPEARTYTVTAGGALNVAIAAGANGPYDIQVVFHGM